MYKAIYQAIQILPKGDIANLKRYNLKSLKNTPAYFRVLGLSQAADNLQTQRILYLMLNTKISSEDGVNVAQALINAGVKENQIIQLTRSGGNSIEYLKRQLIRCKNVDMHAIGKLAQYWGENTRRQLLKDFILTTAIEQSSETN
jgi:CRISPR system Cascade subunit CasB